MHTPSPRVLRAALAFLLLLLLGPASRVVRAGDAAAAPAPDVVVDGVVEVRASGDAATELRVTLSPTAWARVRAVVVAPADLLRMLRLRRAAYELAAPPDVAFDDAARSFRVRDVQLGAARHLGDGRWALGVPDGLVAADAVAPEAREVVLRSRTPAEGGDATTAQRWRFTFDAGTSEVRFDSAASAFAWRREPAPEGASDVDVRVRARDRLITGAYKVYADPDLDLGFGPLWVAKAVMTNRGRGTARDVRVRFRLGTWSEWSPWQRHGDVVPGQTVVARFHPVIDARVLSLRSATAADVLVEWTCSDAAGPTHREEDAARTTLLGMHEFVNADVDVDHEQAQRTHAASRDGVPLLAAWVSQNDAVVMELASAANRAAGGVSARASDDDALRVLRECYEILRRNDVRYLVSPSLVYRPARGEARHAQRVRFPRDTVRDRAGTCVDLAILYAALANAVGLSPGLAWVPQHCFPWVQLPSGRRVAVEVTGVAGGLAFGSRGFDEVLAEATENLKAWPGDGRLVDVDVKAWWGRGVACPDLPELPPDTLARWGWSEAGRGTPVPLPAQDPLVGRWVGTVSVAGAPAPWEATVEVKPRRRLGFEANVSLTGRADAEASAPATVDAAFVGERARDGYAFRADARTVRRAPGAPPVTTGPALLSVRVDAGRLRGRVGSDDDGWAELDLGRAGDVETPPAADPLVVARDLLPARTAIPRGFTEPPGGSALSSDTRDALEASLRGLPLGSGEARRDGATVDSVVWQHASDGIPVAVVAVDAPGADAAFGRRLAAEVPRDAVILRVGAAGRWAVVSSSDQRATLRAAAAWREHALAKLRTLRDAARRASLPAGAASPPGGVGGPEPFEAAIHDLVVGWAPPAPAPRIEGFLVRRRGTTPGTVVFRVEDAGGGLLATERWRHGALDVDAAERSSAGFLGVEGEATTIARTTPPRRRHLAWQIDADGTARLETREGEAAPTVKTLAAPDGLVSTIAMLVECLRALPPTVDELDLLLLDRSGSEPEASPARVVADGVRRWPLASGARSARVYRVTARGPMFRVAFDAASRRFLGLRADDGSVDLEPIDFDADREPRSAEEAAAAAHVARTTGDRTRLDRLVDWPSAFARAFARGSVARGTSEAAWREGVLSAVASAGRSARADALGAVLLAWARFDVTLEEEAEGTWRVSWPTGDASPSVVVHETGGRWSCIDGAWDS